MSILIVIFLIIILVIVFIHFNIMNEYFLSCEKSSSGSNDKNIAMNTKNISNDTQIPPIYTFTGQWLLSDIYNPKYINYYNHKPWLDNDINNLDNGYQYVRPNGTPLFM